MARLGILLALATFAGLAVLGLALGAESQREVFLESDLTAAQQAAKGTSSNLVILTAVPVALGAAGLITFLSRHPFRRRLAPSAALFGASYLLVNFAQGSWPNYNAYVDDRTADLANTLMIANLPASPSVLVPGLAIIAGLLAAIHWSLTGLLGERADLTFANPLALLRRQVGLVALSAPFLIVAFLGTLRLLMELPGDQRGVGPYLFVLPAMMVTFLALLGTSLAKTWQLGVWVRNGRLAGSVQSAWLLLGRIELVLAGLVAALAMAATFLAPIDRPDLELGRVFSVTTRSHTQFMLLLLLPLLPAADLHRRVRRSLAFSPMHAATLESAPHVMALATVTTVALSLLFSALLSFLAAGALWPWIVAAAPLALLASLTSGPKASMPAALLFSFLLWALGNTVVATYDGNQEGALAYDVPAGLLALWRTLAIIFAGAAVSRVIQGFDARPARATVLLAIGTGSMLAVVALILMPLSAWLTPRAGTDALAVGSLLASLDPAVRITVHTLAAILSISGAIMFAALVRPEWFNRRRSGLVATIRAKARTTG